MGRRTIAAGLVAGLSTSLLVVVGATPGAGLPGFPEGVQVPACSVRQLTSSEEDSEQPEISGDGRFVTFTSGRDLANPGSPANDEVFLLEVDSGELTQLTESAVTNYDVDIDFDGSRVAFGSADSYTGENADGNGEIFTVETATGAFTQRSTTTGGGPTSANKDPRLNDAGEVVWAGSRNPLGTNADLNLEVFLDQAGGDVQVTSTTGSGLDLFGLDADRNVLFESSNDLATLGFRDNEDGNQELFVAAPVPGEAPVVHAFQQISDTLGGHRVQGSFSAGSSQDIGVASNGVPFDPSTPIGGRDRIFFMARTVNLLEVVTPDDGHGVSVDPAVAGESLTRIVFGSSADLQALPGDPPKGGEEPGDLSLVLELPEPVYTEALEEQDLGPIQVEVVRGGSAPYGHSPDIDRSGRRIVFESSRDLTGANDDGSDEVFIAFCGAGEASFSDVGTGHPFFHEVEWMAAAGVTTGFPEGTYRPSASVTRQSMSAFLYRLAGNPPFVAPGAPSFDDVGAGHPFFHEVEWMAEVGVTTGFPDGTFRPASPVTRQSMSAFLHRISVLADGDGPPDEAPFPDVGVTHPFVTDIQWMVDEGITTGFPDGTFRPSAPVSRQGMSAFMHRLVRAGGPGLFGGTGFD